MIREINNERELLAKIAKGNHHSFRIIFDRYRNKIYSYSFRILRSESAAEEIVQEVFINIWLNREALSSIENLGGYVRQVTRNSSLDALRKIARETVAFSLKNKDWKDVDLQTENHIYYNDIREALNKALETLPPQQKLVYKMCKIEGMKHIEVARQLGISVQTVRTHLKVASQTIKTIMQSHIGLVIIAFLLSVDQHIIVNFFFL